MFLDYIDHPEVKFEGDIEIKHRSALAYLMKKVKEGELNFNSRDVRRVIRVLNFT